MSVLRSLADKLRGASPTPEVVEAILDNQFNRLRHAIQHHARVRSLRSVLVTSAVEGEGKTTVSLGLARAIARTLDHWSLLVETDLRRPTLARRLGMQPGPGLAGHLCDGIPLAEVIQPTSQPKLSTIFAGRGTFASTELVSSGQMRRLVDELIGRYPDRILVFDSPPVLATPEPLSLAHLVDGVVLVVRADRTPRKLIRSVCKAIPGTKLLGAVLNGATGSAAAEQYHAYYPVRPGHGGRDDDDDEDDGR